MDRMLLQIDDTTHRLRRVGRLARRRMRLEGAELTNGSHTDGRVTVTISGLGGAAAGAPDTFDWEADRPIALVIVRAGIDGDDVAFHVGPASAGSGAGALIGDGTGIRYIAFCYDAEPEPPRSRSRHFRPSPGAPAGRQPEIPGQPATPTSPASIVPDPRPPRPTALGARVPSWNPGFVFLPDDPATTLHPTLSAAEGR